MELIVLKTYRHKLLYPSYKYQYIWIVFRLKNKWCKLRAIELLPTHCTQWSALNPYPYSYLRTKHPCQPRTPSWALKSNVNRLLVGIVNVDLGIRNIHPSNDQQIHKSQLKKYGAGVDLTAWLYLSELLRCCGALGKCKWCVCRTKKIFDQKWLNHTVQIFLLHVRRLYGLKQHIQTAQKPVMYVEVPAISSCREWFNGREMQLTRFSKVLVRSAPSFCGLLCRQVPGEWHCL